MKRHNIIKVRFLVTLLFVGIMVLAGCDELLPDRLESEGSQGAEVVLTLGTPYSGQVGEQEESFYQVAVEASTAYTLTLSDISYGKFYVTVYEDSSYTSTYNGYFDSVTTLDDKTVQFTTVSDATAAYIKIKSTILLNSEEGSTYTLTVTQDPI